MKVVHLTRSLSRSAGGPFYSVSGLALALAKAGVDVGVMGGADQHFGVDRQQWGDVPLHPYPLSDAYGFSWGAFRPLLNLKPDVLHVHGIWAATSIYARFAQLAGIPVVISPHGMLEAWILGRRRRVKRLHGALFERPMLYGGHVHALNTAEYTAVAAYMPGAAKRMFVLPNGTSEVASRQVPSERRGVLYIGRLHPKKQVLELARAWVRSPALDGITLTIAGWGDAGYEAQVQAVADTSLNVKFIGAAYGDDKQRAFETARAFILPSLSEGLPMSVLEALQYGCLPIITDQCNLPELLIDGAALRMASDLSDLELRVSEAVGASDFAVRRRSEFLMSYAKRYRWSEIAALMIGQYQDIVSQHADTALVESQY